MSKIDDQNHLEATDRYQLIDFGEGRKLESLGGYIIDRPSPAAEGFRRHDAARWDHVDARFNGTQKAWRHTTPWPIDLDIHCGPFRMPVAPTPYGHLGLFPEQYDNWQWLAQRTGNDDQPANGLNLFAYTGASTMALVVAGYRVAHVDAAKPNVQAARRAAAHNGWPDAEIRFLVDDAAKFTAREVRRGRNYQTIVLDPPAYGHSPQGKTWRLERDLWPLLNDCLRLLDPNNFRLLITGHSPAVDHHQVVNFLKETQFYRRVPANSGLLLDAGRSQLKDRQQRGLDCGFYVRLGLGAQAGVAVEPSELADR